jgi:hypothetical protein
MRLKKQEREFFRKVLENFIVKNPHSRQFQVVDHFVQEGIARKTVYNDLNRCKNGQLIVCDTRIGPPSFWTSSMKVKFKRLVNHRKGVSQSKLNKKIYKNQTAIGRQIQKLVVDN